MPDLQAILLTAYTEPEDLIAAINEGRVYRYVTKPWNTADWSSPSRTRSKPLALRRERDGLLGRLERRLDAMSVLVDISAQAGAPQSHAQLLELVTRALPRDGARSTSPRRWWCRPGRAGRGRRRCTCTARARARRRRGDPARRARSRARDLQPAHRRGRACSQPGRASGQPLGRARALERAAARSPAACGEIRSSLHRPIIAPGAQGGVVGLFFVGVAQAGRFYRRRRAEPRGAGDADRRAACAACRRASSTSAARWS